MGNVPLYETGNARPLAAPFERQYRRVTGWKMRTETCSKCRRASATTLRVEELRADLALCATCADPAFERTKARLARSQALVESVRAEDALGGLIGMAVPYEEPTLVGFGQWEVFSRGAFTESAAPIILEHRGPQLTAARAFPMRNGLFFEADLLQRTVTDVLQRHKGVSIEFHATAETTEPYRGGQLRRVRAATLSAIALIKASTRQPVYRSAWCAARSATAWERVYRGQLAENSEIAREACS